MNQSCLIICDASPANQRVLAESLRERFPSRPLTVAKSTAQAVAAIQDSVGTIVFLGEKIYLREGIRLARFVAGELGASVFLVHLRFQEGEESLPTGIVTFDETDQTHSIRKTITRALSAGEDHVPEAMN